MEHNILWTGGWDSTFRVLDLVLNKGRVIQPYYIMDNKRKSTKMELNTIEEIKQMIYQKDINKKGKIKEGSTPKYVLEKYVLDKKK